MEGTSVPEGVATGTVAAGTEIEGSAKGLKSGSLNLFSSVVIAVASVAPAYSLAATLGLLAFAVGLRSPFIMIVSFIPMIMVSSAFYWMNKADPDCGQSFIWSVRAFGPQLGWAVGFAAIAASMIVMANLVQIASLYMLEFLNLHTLANSTFWVTFFGVLWLIGIGAIVATGIEISARTQYVLMGVQMISMFVFAAWALIKAYTRHPSFTFTGHNPPVTVHTPHFYLTWFSWHHLTWVQITQGIVLAIFLYWGWDTATSVNEESKDAHVLPGVSAVLSTVLLVLTYVFVTVACQAYLGSYYLSVHWADVFTPLARAVGGPSVPGQVLFRFVMIAVFTSGAASALTTLLPLTRSTLSMASHKAFPKIFGKVHPRYMTPFWGTVIMTVISIVWYAGMTAISPNILGDAIGALGLMVCFVYGFTGFASGVYYRKELFKSAKNFLLIGLVPFVGGIIMMVVLYYAGKTYWAPSYSYTWPDTGINFFGVHVGVTFVLGVGVIALSFILMFITWPIYKKFYSRKPETWPGEGQPIPYSDETVL
ncbi:MAG TPA: APC family permease [Thermoleophilia bacterium]|nr:APC family permease [Thermoleophilia bacterium]